MNILVWLVLGGLIGWAASALLRMREGIPFNVIVGIVGAVLGGWFPEPLCGGIDHQSGQFQRTWLDRVVPGGGHPACDRQLRAARRTVVGRVESGASLRCTPRNALPRDDGGPTRDRPSSPLWWMSTEPASLSG